MRGIAPVFVDKKFQGSIEVMLDFSQLETIAKSQGLNIFILLNKSFESDCIYNTGENSIKNYYILNPNVNNMNILPNLRRFDFENLNFAKFGSSYFYSKVLRDVSNNKVGYIILYYNDDLITTSRLDLIIH
ncbi:hypothetical protein [Campylobacter geochelonis]|nr:hypothetical protein [Campylobacter geochelonis]